ncbi:MAG: tRNA pseudouridine(55) synthase TruB [Salinivirgaceae bacterium]|nr:tRNA pseudouridine(55) synthase TruB [Salinivirgaceae bacterium]
MQNLRIFEYGKDYYDFAEGQVILIDKPLRWTSFDVVNKVRYLLSRYMKVKRLKVGHAGTLDPLASGLLIVCTGQYTKLIDQIQATEKEYIATFKLGKTTPSFDLETEVDSTCDCSHITIEQVKKALDEFIGEQDQIPPMFSAKKVDGQRAYEAARQNKEIELKPSRITITEVELINSQLPMVTARIRCSKGTYIRSIARDLGQKLGCGATLYELRRTTSGNFLVNNAVDVLEFEKFIKNLPPIMA